MEVSAVVMELLRSAGLSERFTFRDLVLAVERVARKKIEFVPWPFPPDVTGATLDCGGTLRVFYAEGSGAAYQQLIKLHELVHVILGRGGECAAEGRASVLDAVRRSLAAYGHGDLVLRSVTGFSHEPEIDEAAVKLLSQLAPERNGGTRSLARLILD